jgi:serine/threonine protein kinase
VAVKQVKKSELSVSQQRRFKKEVALMLLVGDDDDDGVGGEGGGESKTAPQGGITTTGGEASASSSSSCSKGGVVQLIGWYDEGSSYFAVMELLEGGELFDHIHKERRYEESEARSIARTLMATLVVLGNKGIVSRQSVVGFDKLGACFPD